MKVYLASDQKELCIRLANIINRSGNTCIMSDEDSEDYMTLLKDVRSSMSGYDISILISKEPMKASIEANRMGGIRATVCKDTEDAEAAIEAKSNLIILDSSKVYRMDTRSIIKSIEDSFESPAPKQKYAEEIPAPKKEKVQQPQRIAIPAKSTGGGIGSMFGSIKGAFGKSDSEKGSGMVKEKPVQKVVEKPAKVKMPEMAPLKKKGKGGFLGSLKDTFGVE